MADEQQPKIIVDDDWKSQAKAEKAKLSEAEKAKEAEAGAGGAADPRDPNRPLGFMDLIQMLATQALMYMGAFPDPKTGKAMVALDLAKMHVDLLAVLEEKTKGNTTDDEGKALAGVLSELRMQYVEIATAVQKAYDEGRIGPNGEIGGIDPTAPGGPAGVAGV